MALPKDIPTLEAFNTKNLTHVDQVFLSEELMDWVVLCMTVLEFRPPRVDHFPIITRLLTTTQTSVPRPRRNFKQIDWATFQTHLRTQLDHLPHPDEFTSIKQFTMSLNMFTDIITQAIADNVPLVRLSLHTKCWWSPELAAFKKVKVRLEHKAHHMHQQPNHPCHEEARLATQLYAGSMDDVKDKTWLAYLESLTDSTIWDAGHMVMAPGTDSGWAHIPNLVQ
ncbi:hypothetical protein BDQ17DRAFT_1255945 [Cyathus striatus]|nr:hypothetical protein BDQ17DRAFT_1255945 [Cyathus striatus]